MIELTDTSIEGARVVLDGSILEHVFARRLYEPQENGFRLSLGREEFSERAAAHRFADLPKEILILGLSGSEYDLITDEEDIFFDITLYRDANEQFFISINFDFNTDDWKRLWSIAEYRKVFIELMKERNLTNGVRGLKGFSPGNLYLSDDIEDDDYFIDVVLPVDDPDARIDTEIRAHAPLLTELHLLTNDILLSRARSESVVLQFDFPDEVRVACEQYLLYFVQFLKDLGVEATAELQHYAGDVLFAVTPTDKNEALDRIRAALETYLRLPINNVSGGETSVAMQRLASNIYHLRSQLALAQAVLEAKDATIQAQQVTINQHQHRELGGEVILNSMREASHNSSKSDSEEVFDGIAEITRYEGKGFAVNLPEIYRRLKQLFQDDDASA